ncbi:hypothetical protein GCM10027298_09340 [Epidermidibacterium keratini]
MLVAILFVSGMIGILVSPMGGFGMVAYPAWLALCVARLIDPFVRGAGLDPYQALSITLALCALLSILVAVVAGSDAYGVGYLLIPVVLIVVIGTFVQSMMDLESRRQ